MFGLAAFSTLSFSTSGGGAVFTGRTWVDKCKPVSTWVESPKPAALQQKCNNSN